MDPVRQAISQLWTTSTPELTQRRVYEAFLAQAIHLPRTGEDAFAVVETAGHGRWVCGFTTRDLLTNYVANARPVAWTGPSTTITGADLVRKILVLQDVGILINPTPGQVDLNQTLPLPPQVLPTLIE